jgi:hypothetical protein
MDYAILLIVTAGLFYFKGSIKSSANLLNSIITTASDVSEDSLNVYAQDILTQNSKQRGLVRKKIEKYSEEGSFATRSEIDKLLNGMLDKDKSEQEE